MNFTINQTSYFIFALSLFLKLYFVMMLTQACNRLLFVKNCQLLYHENHMPNDLHDLFLFLKSKSCLTLNKCQKFLKMHQDGTSKR